jgi:hypothetical protein
VVTALSTQQAAGLTELVAAQDIAAALAVHSRGVDRAEVNLLASAYHPNATVDYGFYTGPAAEFAGILAASQRQSPVTLHRTCNMWIEVDGASARSESYVLAYVETPEADGPVQRLIGGRYLDRHSRRDGRWRLDHRIYVLDCNINRPGASAWAEPAYDLAQAVPRGGHGDADAGRTLLVQASARLTQLEESKVTDISSESIDRALSRQAIHDLLMAYARGVDRADANLLKSIFHPDATVVSGIINGNGPEFAKGIAEYVRSNLTRCFHSVANEWVDVRGDRAVGESYVIATMTVGETDTVSGGRYVSEFERRAGSWKFVSHSFVSDWNMCLPTSYQAEGMYAPLQTRGCFGREDPIYSFWDA